MKNVAYKNIRQMLIENDLPINESENEIASCFKCGRFNINFAVSVNAEQNILSFNFLFPFTIFERCFLDFTVAVCKINNELNGLGTFKINIYDKSFCYCTTTAFNNPFSVCETEQILFSSINTINEYIDRLYKLARSTMTFEEFDTVDNETLATMADVRAGKNLSQTFDSVSELINDLNA